MAFPTETVYGLGARADDAAAMDELRRVKQRPAGKEFSILIASPAEADRHAQMPPVAHALAAAFWPGPLTLVLPDGRGAAVGLRCPGHALTQDLLRRVGAPIAATSANLSGRPAATSAEEVLAALDGRIAAVFDGGPCAIGTASTIVRVAGAQVEVLREGAITAAEIKRAVTQRLSERPR